MSSNQFQQRLIAHLRVRADELEKQNTTLALQLQDANGEISRLDMLLKYQDASLDSVQNLKL